MNIIPRPQKTEQREGAFRVGSPLSVFADDGFHSVADYLVGQIPIFAGDDVRAGLTAATDAPIQLRQAIHGSNTPDVEGYALRIRSSHITIESRSCAGVFYGVQSLLQLLANCEGEIPCADISDNPRYGWRGMHLDVCRHFFEVDFLKRYLDLLALYKFNTFHWHLTEDQGWRLPVNSHPQLTEVSAWRDGPHGKYGGFYTRDDVQEILDYAGARCITVIPEIELPGHAMAALAAYPQLSCSGGPIQVQTQWGIFDEVYCAGNEATFDFLEAVLTDVAELFPSSFIHIGGDECPKTRWKACPKCQRRIAQEGLRDEDHLQSWFVTRISRFLNERGRRLIGWDEILDGGLAPDATVMSWRGTAGGIAAARQGHDVVMTPTNPCYFDYQQSDRDGEPGALGVNRLRDVYAFEPTPVELTDEEVAHVLGGQGNVWTERMSTAERVEYMVLPRMCALSEAVWTKPDRREWSDFHRRLLMHVSLLGRLGYNYRQLDAERP